MQHTDKYQLALIETSDTFSPAPLNENMEKVEAALVAKAEVTDHAALEQRVISLEGHKVAVGTYTGTSSFSDLFIDLGFTPRAVLIQHYGGNIRMAITDKPLDSQKGIAVVENGFTVSHYGSLDFNLSDAVYPFVAIL